MTPPRGAEQILRERARLDFAVDCLAARARDHTTLPPEEAERLRQRTRDRARDLLDDWSKVAHELSQTGVGLQYQIEEGGAQRLLFDFLSPELRNLPPQNPRMKFRANRSLRDVEPSVNLWVKTIDGVAVDEDET
jgi:hypothetical protein